MQMHTHKHAVLSSVSRGSQAPIPSINPTLYKLGLGNIWISIRQMRKLRIREVKLVAQRHTAEI